MGIAFRKNVMMLLAVVNALLINVCEAQLLDEQYAISDTVGSQGSDVEFLIGVRQIIEKDKDRLQRIKNDSSTFEPIFEQLSSRFYHLVNALDSTLQQPMSSHQETLMKYERQHLQEILDFLLDRRRSMEVQSRILEYKIEKEQEVLNFFMKGKMYTILEATVQKGWQEYTAPVSSDTTLLRGDSLENQSNFDARNPNQFNWSVVETERELQILEARFEVAKKTWLFLEQLLALNQDDLLLARSLASKSSSQLAKWQNSLQLMDRDLLMLQKSDSAKEIQEYIKKILTQIPMLSARMKRTGERDSLLVSDIESRMDRLKRIQRPLTEDVSRTSKQIERKNRRLQFMKSPLAPHRVLSFFAGNGPRILFISGLLLAIYFFFRWLLKTILPWLKLKRYKYKEEREERIETLRRALLSGLTIIFMVIGVLILLSEFGINVSVLLGGAAVFSLAIAFGAQSLIKDYFSGFMIITENQYRVGNVISINNIAGVVEDITLRITILRDIEGVAHFIPHSEIKIVSNLSYTWSQVAADIKVSYKENVDKVMEIITDVARGLKSDPDFGKLIIQEPEMLGIETFADSAMVVKVLIKTLPLKQWAVKRELLRRVKNRFDEVGIEIPIPYQKIYYEPAEDLISQLRDVKNKP